MAADLGPQRRHAGHAARFVPGYSLPLRADVIPVEGPGGPLEDATDPHARAGVDPPRHVVELRTDDVQGRKFYYGKGCDACNNTGYRGRMGLYEIMMLDDDLRDMIIKHASTQVRRAEAKKRGMKPVRSAGLMAIYDGVTTIEEVLRVTEDA